ncbi:putative undecaprenyl-phosphate N-acetylglucosaminyl 1-phosphate transferase [Pseudomonas fluorescens]|uniref:Putative undecaprenyl-phosphate N-acetylglucosaminyl 1-phosphate transferase n=1 Tax=Pseudomonas fluorescens TaxID=294 RepID=A0A5E7CCR6_PSEFL|nr:glycosyltransferase family 4 protein [Pseudomonas fluorescens]VVO02156.1 putative undecaprenyl-phosphate N-acetylglucosaminyl 1-phosphate transferase [Pseudomonas fluorescens]
MMLIVLLLAVFACSWLMTLVLRRYALAKSLMDIPNERSSHTLPTPRGGGVSIVLGFVLSMPVVASLDGAGYQALYHILGAGLLVAIIGFADDHGHIAARWRLLGHFMAAAWVLFGLHGLGQIQVFGAPVDLGWLGNVLAAFYLVWMLNLYNFMDGIDGIASAQAIFVSVAGSAIAWLTGHFSLVAMPLILAAAVAGFFVWNFPPARIFMGDAGSGFLGLILGVLSLEAGRQAPELLWSWLILLGVFIVDATVTLFRRLSRREKIYQAHCSHAYQYAARHYLSHKTVTLAVSAINLLWLLPLALIVGVGLLDGIVGCVLAYAPLVALAIRFNAGGSEPV